jgi:hypothetical protein
MNAVDQLLLEYLNEIFISVSLYFKRHLRKTPEKKGYLTNTNINIHVCADWVDEGTSQQQPQTKSK